MVTVTIVLALSLNHTWWGVALSALAFGSLEGAYLSWRLHWDYQRAQRVPTALAARQCEQVVSGQFARSLIPFIIITAVLTVLVVTWLFGPSEGSLARLLTIQALLLGSRTYMLGSLERLHALLSGTRRPRRRVRAGVRPRVSATAPAGGN